MVSVGTLKLLGLPRVFLILLAACLAAFAALAWGESCVRFAGAWSLAGVTLPALRAEALAAPADFLSASFATRYVNENGYHQLWVLDAVEGGPVVVAGRVPLADLYDIANRLVLPH